MTSPCSVQSAPVEGSLLPYHRIAPGTMHGRTVEPSHCRTVQSPSSLQIHTKKSGFGPSEALFHTLPTAINPQNWRWGHMSCTKEERSTHISSKHPCLSAQHTTKDHYKHLLQAVSSGVAITTVKSTYKRDLLRTPLTIRQACYDSLKCIVQWKTHLVLTSAISLLIGGTTHWVLCSCSLELALSRVSPCGYSVSMQCPGPWRSPLDPVSEPSTSWVHLLQQESTENKYAIYVATSFTLGRTLTYQTFGLPSLQVPNIVPSNVGRGP